MTEKGFYNYVYTGIGIFSIKPVARQHTTHPIPGNKVLIRNKKKIAFSPSESVKKEVLEILY